MPPSVIADTWSPAELRQAEALARLEGWGQEKRRTASILAELHNVARIDRWIKSHVPDKPPPPQPPLLNASHFLPSRRSKQQEQQKPETKKKTAYQKLSSIMNSLCGYRS